MREPATLRDRIIAADPGLVRLHMAVRATASVGTALGILLLLRAAFHFPLSVPLMGAALGMSWTISVNDPAIRAQRITTLVIWFPAAVCLVLGTLTASNRILGDALFVCVLFLSIYLRAFGQRGAAIGTISVLSFFFALFLRASARDLPWLILALAITALTTYVCRFFIFRDRPALALRSALAAFRARQRVIARSIGNLRALNHHLFRLNETALILDDLLASTNDRIRVLDAELESADAAEHGRTNIVPLALGADAPVRIGWTPRGPFRAGTQLNTGAIAPTTRQAIQLSAAGVLAIVIGELLSPQRWYWAVLAAFVVFLGTSSSGETRTKAWSRIVGTALGVAAGIVVTYPVRGHDSLAFVLLLVCLFAAVYTLRLSYAFMIFFLTIVLSLLYVLLGFFSDKLLLLRLVETAVGATLGGVAATLVLPISTTRVLLNVTVETLQRLDELVATAVNRFSGDLNADPVSAARKLDEAIQSARAQIEPLVAPMRLGGNDLFHTRLMLMTACGYYARALATLAYESTGAYTDGALQEARDAIAGDIREIIALNQGTPTRGIEHPELATPSNNEALSYLYRIDRVLRALAHTLTART
jgi:hypothetical protein